MSKLIRKEDIIEGQVFSRELREYVVPVRFIRQLQTFDEPQEQPEDYERMLNALFNRCYAVIAMGGNPAMCMFCGIREACDKRRTLVTKENQNDKS